MNDCCLSSLWAVQDCVNVHKMDIGKAFFTSGSSNRPATPL